MDASDVLTPALRVLDVGPASAAAMHELADRGVDRYLGLVAPRTLGDASRREDDPRLQELTDPGVALRCSTDLLVLRGHHARLLWSPLLLAHVPFVAVDRSALATLERAGAAAWGRLTRKLDPRGRLTLGGAELEVFGVRHRTPPATRTYLSPVWGVAGLAARLEQAGLQHAVLRWFDGLPDLDPGEDLDILVSDADLAAFRALLAEEPGTIPVDLYSVSGLPASDFRGAAYYPPHLARTILNGAVRHRSGLSVPGPLDHLRSLTYHAVYHKGELSGIESRSLGRPVTDPEHDYRRILDTLAQTLDVELPATLEGLDGFLGDAGWSPSRDARRRMAQSNGWLRSSLVPDRPATAPEPPEMTAFVVRERTAAHLTTDDVVGVLEQLGFEVLAVHDLDDAARERCAQAIRGGNWGSGPLPRSGGGPALLVVALHYAPDPVEPWIAAQYPHLTNQATYWAKNRLRGLVEQRVGSEERFNPVHSADDEEESWEYVEHAVPDQVEALRRLVDARRAANRPAGDLVRVLSRGRRSRVEVVRAADGLVVRKTFHPGARRFLDREIRAMREQLVGLPGVPPVLDTGDGWFTCPYYENRIAGLDESGRLVPVRHLRRMVAVLRAVHERGYDLVDARPHNFLLDPDAGLVLVDFEFLHEYGDGELLPFADSYNFVATPDGFPGDVPVGDNAYDLRWLPFTGMPRAVLVDGSSLVQHAHRVLHRARRISVAPGAPPRRLAGMTLRASRDMARRVYRRIARLARSRAVSGVSSGTEARDG
ncbi:hypothetical protein [Cellulosimicrobium sp. NPDC055967]|uniref:hypothetical protein n=1 Tax=Cellulosimicrobium sp. NPDC055967 TaxID=3345670 RepID=UPI0035D83C7E